MLTLSVLLRLKELEYLQKDRHAYINGLFFERVEEVKSYQRKLWEIINRIYDMESLRGTTISLSSIYDSLPMICHNSVRADQMQVFNVDNNNSAATTTITSGPGSDRNNNNKDDIEYLEWCKNNNPNHPDHCNCHWEEYQV
jgi:hypothetical protein